MFYSLHHDAHTVCQAMTSTPGLAAQSVVLSLRCGSALAGGGASTKDCLYARKIREEHASERAKLAIGGHRLCLREAGIYPVRMIRETWQCPATSHRRMSPWPNAQGVWRA